MGYDGQWTDALLNRLRRDHGLTLHVTVASNPVEALARVNHPTDEHPFDVLVLGLEEVAAWRTAGLLQPVMVAGPGSTLPDAIRPALVRHGGWDGGVTQWFVPVSLGFNVLFAFGAAASAIGAGVREPPLWSALLNPALKGRVILEPNAAVWMGMRLVDPDGARLASARDDKAVARDLFKDVETELKPYREQVATVWTDTATFLSALQAAATAPDGEGLAGSAWDGLARHIGADVRAPLIARVPADGAPAWMDGLAITANAPHPQAALALIEAMRSPALMTAWCAGQGAVPPNSGAWQGLDAPLRDWMVRVLETDAGWSRLWFRPALGPAALTAFGDTRRRFEYP